MSTYRYRGDLKTTGDQLRLRDGGTGSKSSVEIKAGDTAEEGVDVVISTPTAPVDKDAVSIAADEMVLKDTKQTLKAKTLEDPKITAGSSEDTYTIKGLDLTAGSVEANLPALEANDEFTFNEHAQTLTNKTLTLPKINEDVELSATSSELNQLDGTEVGGDAPGDIVTTDGAQTLTDKTLTSPVITNPTVSGLYLSDSSIVFEGATDDDFELTLQAEDPTADVTVTIPAATTTLVGDDTEDTLENKTINDLRYGQEILTDSSGSLTLTPTKVSVLLDSVLENDIITSIDNTNTKYVIISNTSVNDIQIQDNSTIFTGTGGDVPLPSGASTTLIYDDNDSAWRIVGKTGFDGGLALTAISTNTTAEVGKHYITDSSLGSFTITLPQASTLSPSEKIGATIRITDAANVWGALSGSSYNNKVVLKVTDGSGDTINFGDGDLSAISELNLDVSGVWIQLMLKELSGGGYEWVVDDPFWNTVSDGLVTDVTLGANYYNKTELNGGQLDNRYYTETEVDDFLSLKYDASNPAGYETASLLNTRDTNNRARINHTGTQLANTISDFDTAVAANSAVAANTAKVSADGSIDTHSDVDTTTIAPASGQALVWNGSNWVPGSSGLEIKSPASGTISASISSHYVLDTSSGSYTITLPDSASLSSGETKGAVIRIVDSGNNADVNNIVINASGSDDILLGKSYDSGSIIIDSTLTFDVPGTWIQLVLSGSRWVVEGVFI